MIQCAGGDRRFRNIEPNLMGLLMLYKHPSQALPGNGLPWIQATAV